MNDKNRTAKITNTAKLDPALLLADALVRGPSESIEHAEACGAAELAAQTEQLPADGLEHPAFAAAGIVLGAVVEGDELFRPVTLPDGWRIQRTEHNMWTHLVDEHGRTRAKIFYKAAFYDRRAYIRPSRRFSVEMDYDSDDSQRTRVLVKDGATVIHKSPWCQSYEAGCVDMNASRAWLSERFPAWEDPAAYWNA